jgi:hypothetical protein
MSYREQMEETVSTLQRAAQMEKNAAIITIANYGPQLVDMGIHLDRIYAENERLIAIVNLVDLTKERDYLAIRVAELERKIEDER